MVFDGFAMLALLLSAVLYKHATPIDFGLAELRRELHQARLDEWGNKVQIKLVERGSKESYRVTGTTIEARDPVGAMYGALDLAERVRAKGKNALGSSAVSGAPYLQDRALNLFLTLPWDYANNRTDNDPAALTDPQRWWFQNESYWTTLLDEMARDRLNWLDIHGTWDIESTQSPNLYAYFIQSDLYPQVGVAPQVKAANLAQLNHVIDLAHARGIRVSLIAYQTQLAIPQNPNPPYQETESVAYDYTRDVVERMIRQAPGLDAIGFRIGESGRSTSFFNCYLEAVQNSGRNIPLLTRSWLTSKDQVVPIARQYGDFSIEIKYNGEQWGAPYIVAGGRVANWYSYSFEGYLNDSGADSWAHTWPGNPTDEGGTWPAQPYKVVWQVRSNGTHRIFPFYNPSLVRRTIRTMKIGTATGYTVEPLNAYYPASPAYYQRNASDHYTDWVVDRDQLYMMLWGRLGYDPDTPESVFQQRLDAQFGAAAAPLAQAWKAGSEIVSRAFTAYSLGADHRAHAPELEAGGDRDTFAQTEPFDPVSYISAGQYAAIASVGGVDGRDPTAAAKIRDLAATASTFASQAEALAGSAPEPLRLKEILTAIRMQSYLGHYYAGRLEDAHLWAQWTGAYNVPMGATSPLMEAKAAWAQLSSSADALYYKPFTERLRMQTNTFHWSAQLPGVNALSDGTLYDWRPPFPAVHREPPATAVLSWREEGGSVVCTIPAAGLSEAWLYEKPLTSSTYFHRIPMSIDGGGQFRATFPRRNWGHMIAADVSFSELSGDRGYVRVSRVPSPEAGAPYLMVPAKRAPTPVIFSPLGAIWFLNPSVLSPQKHSLLVIGTGALGFFVYAGLSDQRKILDPVNRGMRLVILEQDFSRYRLDFLPVPPQWEQKELSTFDPGGALGLPAVQAPSIIKQRLLPTSGWQVFGNGGIARYPYGAGEIWVVSARLVEKAYYPPAAEGIATILRLGQSGLPVVYVDGGHDYPTNGGSLLPDMMNALGIPFRSLNEVVADPSY